MAGIAAGVVFVACIEVAVTAKCAVCTGSHFYMYVYLYNLSRFGDFKTAVVRSLMWLQGSNSLVRLGDLKARVGWIGLRYFDSLWWLPSFWWFRGKGGLVRHQRRCYTCININSICRRPVFLDASRLVFSEKSTPKPTSLAPQTSVQF